MYAKLLLDAELLRDAEQDDIATRAYLTMGGAMTAWHMAGWLHESLDAAQRRRLRALAARPIRSRKALQDYACEAEPAIRVCRKIATGEGVLEATAHPEPAVAGRLWISEGLREWSPEDLLAASVSFWRRVLIGIGQDSRV
jgi:hypothetical protein